MKQLVQILLFFIIYQVASAQEIVSVTEKGHYTKQEIIAAFNLPLVKYGATFYKVNYASADAKGALDTLSGLLVVPDSKNLTYPVLVYQHGTSDCKTCVPSRFGSNGGSEGQVGLLFAGMGFVSLLPDFVGMGDARGFQTYVHASTTFSATDDMVNAVRNWAPDNDLSLNNQLFITGYSQGGYASMVFQEGTQKKYGASSVTAATHLSGPYSLSGAMRDLMLGEDVYLAPAFIAVTVLGMNEVYGFYDDLGDIFNPEYIDDIQSYYNNEISLTTLNERMVVNLVTNTGVLLIKGLFRGDVLDAIVNDPEHPVNQILRENDAYKWTPESPTRIFYCKGDDIVPYQNSIIARDSMYARGADPNTLIVTDVDSNGDHGTCVGPTLTQTLLFFLIYQSVTTSTFNTIEDVSIQVYPNPAQDVLYIDGYDASDVQVIVWDMDARQRIVQDYSSAKAAIDVSALESGIYIVTLIGKDGLIANKKLVISK
ncbi:MAG: T9SS type A sorting domain-containing protein [Chitinophagales bacterium]|nr:T9SS type A sorting domain-containing protein [Chitinophagales bacterium]